MKWIFQILLNIKPYKYLLNCLLKYIYKGHDKAQTTFEPILSEKNLNNEKNTDEIKEYVDARYISAIEAVWHIFHFLMHEQDPPVIRLDYHLENENTIYFQDDEKLRDVKNKTPKDTKFFAWFKFYSFYNQKTRVITMIFLYIRYGKVKREFGKSVKERPNQV